MIDQNNWPDGYHIDPNYQHEGPEATPGNMRAICELLDSLKGECSALRERIQILEEN